MNEQRVIGIDPYWTIVIPYQARFASDPWMPDQATGPFSTITRGAFDTKYEALTWARTHLPKGAKVRFHKVKP